MPAAQQETKTMPNIKKIINDDSQGLGRYFALFIQALIVLSLVTFSLETLPSLTAGQRAVLRAVEVVTVLIFTLEYLLRVYTAEQKLKFIFSFYGLVDLLAILPFYLATSVDMRSLRAFRLLRLLRILKIARYSSAMRRFYLAFQLIRSELLLFMCTTFILLYLAAVGIYYFEHDAQPEAFSSIFSSLWWAVATLTTVGYGDVYPITVGGRMFTFFVLMIGLSVVAAPAGLVSSSLTEARNIEAKIAAEREANQAKQSD